MFVPGAACQKRHGFTGSARPPSPPNGRAGWARFQAAATQIDLLQLLGEVAAARTFRVQPTHKESTLLFRFYEPCIAQYAQVMRYADGLIQRLGQIGRRRTSGSQCAAVPDRLGLSGGARTLRTRPALSFAILCRTPFGNCVLGAQKLRDIRAAARARKCAAQSVSVPHMARDSTNAGHLVDSASRNRPRPAPARQA